ncbi:MAG: metallophosphoesterase [Bdellovibrionaceae bacterium]|nr:metallophosphoesterase [Pseudobdellovibrionaceae bacterium]
MFLRLINYFCSFGLFLCAFVSSETLIIQSSDQHSSYKKMSNFLASIEVLSRRFKTSYPKGSVVIVINGDFSGFGQNAQFHWDRGSFGYIILSELAKKYSIIYTFGNHDAFAWSDSQLFLEQMSLLKHSGVNLVVENTVFYPEYQDLFKPYVDIPLSSENKMRLIGYTIPDRKKDTLLRFQENSPMVIEKFTGLNSIERHLKEANSKDEIKAVALSMHLGVSKVKNTLSKLDSDTKAKLKIAFAGHDHKNITYKLANTQIIDSGAYFKFSQILLDNKGEILSLSFFNTKDQSDFSLLVDENSLEYSLINDIRNFLTSKTIRENEFRPLIFPVLFDIPRKTNGHKIEVQKSSEKDKKPPCMKTFKGKKAFKSLLFK